MAQLVVNGAQCQCSFGAAPSALIILPTGMVNGSNMPAATIMDYIPIANIPPFGMCSAPTNPAVIAAQGSPVPCVPVISAPWAPGSPTVMIGGKPALNSSSKCMCTWAGVISITTPGQVTTTVP
jgi:hypothetical protein